MAWVGFFSAVVRASGGPQTAPCVNTGSGLFEKSLVWLDGGEAVRDAVPALRLCEPVEAFGGRPRGIKAWDIRGQRCFCNRIYRTIMSAIGAP
jgi:hypothetical protein